MTRTGATATRRRTADGRKPASLAPQPNLPVLGIAGCSGAGKTALLETLLPRLRRKGLDVAVIKHDVHGLAVDHPGKDSDRFFRSGADVLVQGPGETFFRRRLPAGDAAAPFSAPALLRYDLVLVEGWKAAAIPKVWLLKPGERPPARMPGLLAVLPPGPDRLAAVTALLERWLAAQWLKTPLFGGILLGGGNSRGAARRLERAAELLGAVTDRLVLAGSGRVPAGMAGIPRLPGAPGIPPGPMAAMLSAARWAPHAAWLMASPDAPGLSPELLRRLLSTRAPGTWATLLDPPGRAAAEPALAYYDFRARFLAEELAAAREFRLRRLLRSAKAAALPAQGPA